MCCTRNWYQYMATPLYTLFKYNDIKKLYMFIEDDAIPGLKDKRIKYININNTKEYILPSSPNYNTKYSKLSYVRCYFSKLLKEDKLLYIDADALVIDNLADLWGNEFNDKYIIGVKEPGAWSKHLGIADMDNKYINSVILLMDLSKIRKDKLDNAMIDLLNTNKYYFPDQDVINIVFKDKIKYVSNIYNSTETTGFRDDAKIIHYIRERKGWFKTSPKSEIWFKYNNEMLIMKGESMKNYKVKALKKFDDYEGQQIGGGNAFTTRKVNDIFYCTQDRYEYLKAHNAVELVEVLPLPEPKTEAPITTTPSFTSKEFTKTTKKKKKLLID